MFEQNHWYKIQELVGRQCQLIFYHLLLIQLIYFEIVVMYSLFLHYRQNDNRMLL
jgi:hypothetical protein